MITVKVAGVDVPVADIGPQNFSSAVSQTALALPNSQFWTITAGGATTQDFSAGATASGTTLIVYNSGAGACTVKLSASVSFTLAQGQMAQAMWNGFAWVLSNSEIIVTSSITLTPLQKYRVRGTGIQLTLPASVAEGQSIEILAEDACQVLQSDAQHSISYLNKWYTTQGVAVPPPAYAASGFLALPSKSKIVLTYEGNGMTRLAIPAAVAALPSAGAQVNQIVWSADGNYMAVAIASSGNIPIYKRNGVDSWTIIATVAGQANTIAIALSPDATYLIQSYSAGGGLRAWKRAANDTWSALTNPSAPTVAANIGIEFSPDGLYFATLGGTGASGLSLYKLTSADTWTVVSTGSYGGTGGITAGPRWSYDGNYICCGTADGGGTPPIAIFRRNGDALVAITPFGPAFTTYAIDISADGVYLLNFVGNALNYIYKKTRDADTWTLLPAPPNITACAAGHASVSMSFDMAWVAMRGDTSPYIYFYRRYDDSFVLTGNIVAPSGTITVCKFSPDGVYLAAGVAASPYIVVYKTTQVVTKGWIVEYLSTLYQNQPDYIFK